MTKFYTFLAAFLGISLVQSQGLEDFTNSNATASYSDNSFVGNDGVTWTYVASRDENGDANGSGIDGNALMLRRVSSDSKITSSTIANGIGDFSVKLYKGFTGGGDRQVELFVNGTSYGTSEAFDDFDEHIFSVTGINVAGDVVIEIKNTTSKQVIIDDISWTATSANPSLNITSPTNNQVLPLGTTSWDATFTTSNFQIGATDAGLDGHVHGTLNGNDLPMHYSSDPISLSGLTPGDHTLVLMLVDNSHQPIDPAVEATVTFSIPAVTEVENLAALRADVTANGTGGYYTLTNAPVVTYIVQDANTGVDARNQRYIQDDTAGILIDDSDGVLSSSIAEGDALSGLMVQAGEFSGVMQIVPLEDATVDSSGNAVAPQTISVADYLAAGEEYESELITFENVTFEDAGGTFSVNTNFNMTNGSTVPMRTSFDLSDIIDTTIPATANVTALGAEFNGSLQVLPRTLADISTLGVEDLESSSQNVKVIVDANRQLLVVGTEVFSIQVINPQGKVVKNSTNLQGLPVGVYFVKILNTNKETIVRKVIVK